jgi:integrase
MAYFDKARGKWRGNVYFEGVRKTKLFGVKGKRLDKDRKAAEAWEISTRNKLALERWEKGKYSLKEAATDYLEDCEKKHLHKTTIANKRRFLKELEEKVGDIALENIEPKALKDYIYSKEKASQSNRARKDLSAFFSYCVKFFDLKQNPINLIDRLPEDRKNLPVPTEKQMARLMAKLKRWDRNFVAVFMLTGARKEELLRLTWTDDVNFDKREVRLGTKKSRSREMTYRYIGMDDTLYRIFQDQYNSRLGTSDFVFQNRNPRFKNYGNRFADRRHFIRNICRQINRDEAKKPGGGDPVPIFGYHSLRRFYTSVLAEKGTNLPTLQKLLGHSRPSTTDRYVSSISEDARVAQEKIGSVVDELMNGKKEEVEEEQNQK